MYDLIIVGGGPAGLSAAIYAARYKLSTVVIAEEPGGLAATAHKVCNYPSYVEVSGFELMQKMIEQVKLLEVPIKFETVVKIQKKDSSFVVQTKGAEIYEGKKVLFAAGTKRRKLNLPGEDRFFGKGVSYCATCDAAFFADTVVSVIGGSDAALTAALLLSEHAKKVYIIYRKEKFLRAEPSWIELVEKNNKIKTLFNEEAVEILGDNKVTGIRLKSGKELPLDGVFIEVGSVPSIELVKALGAEESKGYIVADREQRTNVDGLFAAGDITNNKLKQIVTAAAEGAVAAFTIYKEIKQS